MNKSENKRVMKTFNTTIRVEIELDSIAQKLLSEFPEDYKHKELVTETIIGNAYQNGGIDQLYNALNGYTNDVDFKEGDMVTVDGDTIVSYSPCDDDDNSGKKAKSERYPLVGKVMEVNIYKHNKLLVEYKYMNSSLREVTNDIWVDHKSCTKIPS